MNADNTYGNTAARHLYEVEYMDRVLGATTGRRPPPSRAATASTPPPST